MRRIFGVLVAAASLLAMSVPDAARAASVADGTYKGTYSCGFGTAGLTVKITSDDRSRLKALASFYGLPNGPEVGPGSYRLSGRYVATSRELTLIAGKWVVRPPGFVKSGFKGKLSADRQTISGRLTDDTACKVKVRRVS